MNSMNKLDLQDHMETLLASQEKATIAPRMIDLLERNTRENIKSIVVVPEAEFLDEEEYIDYNFMPISTIENTLGKSIVSIEI